MYNYDLENIAIELRKALDMNPDIIINSKNLNELC